MKMYVYLLIACTFIFIRCKEPNPKPALPMPKADTSSISESENKKLEDTMPAEEVILTTMEVTPLGALLAGNEGKYPRDIKLLENPLLKRRMTQLLGKNYADVIKNFEVQSPVLSEKGIYKTTGCKSHSCPTFFTTIYYDVNTDNLNIIIDRSGKQISYQEKGYIPVTESLKQK